MDRFQALFSHLGLRNLFVYTEDGQVPGIVFARGPAVAVLILLDSDGETYAVLTEQVIFQIFCCCKQLTLL